MKIKSKNNSFPIKEKCENVEDVKHENKRRRNSYTIHLYKTEVKYQKVRKPTIINIERESSKSFSS